MLAGFAFLGIHTLMYSVRDSNLAAAARFNSEMPITISVRDLMHLLRRCVRINRSLGLCSLQATATLSTLLCVSVGVL